MSEAFYNEIEPYAVQWLQNLEREGHIASGKVDARSIVDLKPKDLEGHRQVHCFAGLGGWSYALRLAGWPDDVPVWTGSCPCQPFSTAGRAKGSSDERHLWPAWFKLIKKCRPGIIFGEQVGSPDGLKWLDLVFSDLERTGYTCLACDVCAAFVGAPHIRQRLYFVAVLNDAPMFKMSRTETAVRVRSGHGKGEKASQVRVSRVRENTIQNQSARKLQEKEIRDRKAVRSGVPHSVQKKKKTSGNGVVGARKAPRKTEKNTVHDNVVGRRGAVETEPVRGDAHPIRVRSEASAIPVSGVEQGVYARQRAHGAVCAQLCDGRLGPIVTADDSQRVGAVDERVINGVTATKSVGPGGSKRVVSDFNGRHARHRQGERCWRFEQRYLETERH